MTAILMWAPSRVDAFASQPERFGDVRFALAEASVYRPRREVMLGDEPATAPARVARARRLATVVRVVRVRRLATVVHGPAALVVLVARRR